MIAGLSRRYVTFLCLVGIGLTLAGLVSLGYYPIAVVNSKVVMERDFARQFAITAVYSDKRALVAQSTSSQATVPTGRELERAVLDELIEEQIIRTGLEREAGGDTAALVDKKIAQYDTDPQLRGAAEALLGISFGEFRERVLMPEAEREVLSGRLFLQGKTLEEWLTAERGRASVRLFSGRYQWADGTVAER